MGRECGRYSTYTSGCRCGECREAANEYARQRNELKREQLANATPPLIINTVEEGDVSWQADGACRDMDPALFFPVSSVGSNIDWAPALNACAECPVVEQCLDYALRTDQRFGVWGGTRPNDRKYYKKGLPLKRACKDCGTVVGAKRQYCDLCRAERRADSVRRTYLKQVAS